MSESIRKSHELVTKLNVYCDEYYNKNELECYHKSTVANARKYDKIRY